MSPSSPVIAPIQLGVVDWEHDVWAGAFYPDDMPEEWRLAYFNTQFGCVFLRRDAWLRVDDEHWKLWSGECHDQFSFVLDAVPGDVTPPALGNRCWLALPDDPSVLWFDRTTDLKALAAVLRGHGEGVIWLISADAHLGQIERVRTLLELLGMNA